MMIAGWSILFLSFAVHASVLSTAQVSKECGTPTIPLHTKLDKKYLLGQKYSHGEKVFYDCADDYTPFKGRRAIECFNGNWTRLTLKCEKRSCGNAGALLNGQFIYQGNSVLGDRVHAVCNYGYTLKGMEYMICKRSGWSGEFPTCEEGVTGVPTETTCSNPAVANGVRSRGDVSGFRVGDSVTFTCSQGFQLDGSQQVTCASGGQWQPELPQCLPSNDMTCKEPKAQLQSRFTVINGLKPVYRPGNSLSFSCTAPYRLNGSTTATCGLTGNWDPRLPKCTLPKCPELKIPHSMLSSNRRRVSSDIYVRCKRGYKQQGPGKVVCLQDGTWSKIPKCVSEREAKTTCSKPAVANGVMSTGDAPVFSVGDSVSFTCSQGFHLDGSQQVTCGSDGQWQPPLPQCRPTGGCGVPPNGDKSSPNLADDYITLTSFAPGYRVRYVCDIGYESVRGRSDRSCINGKWTPLLLKCERKLCGSAGEITNGQFMYTGSEFGDTVTAVCDEGYQLIGRGIRNCMSNGWDGRIPICEVVQCLEPPMVTNAEPTSPLESSYTYRSVISYRCREGTLTGQREIWCTKDGTWSSPPPVCKEDITCPPPNVPNSSRMGALREPYTYRNVVYFQCDWGFQMVGPNTVSCGPEGQWIPSLPMCRYRRHYRRY